MIHARQSNKPLCGKRILVCGKGGSGKSTMVALMATILQRKAYEVMVLDGDASNPEGLVRLLFGLGVEGEPKPLIEFFGGIDVVTCPVEDPSPLTRNNDSNPVPENRIDLYKELSPEYYLRKGSTALLQVGKIETYGQGCDGPLEKVVRDFICSNLEATIPTGRLYVQQHYAPAQGGRNHPLMSIRFSLSHIYQQSF